MPVAETLSSLVMKGSVELCANLIESYAKKNIDSNSQKLEKLKTNITPHIDATFMKCSFIKTLLNPQRPANFLSIYATQRFRLNEKSFDHYSTVDYIKEQVKNLIITGTGGSGKSMFTRYLWLSLFVHSDGKIPLFIELRNTNNISLDKITAYIRQTISAGNSRITEADYNNYLTRGDFILILDGFDEILENRKQSVQQQILELAENYPKLKIVITSRPDSSHFGSWPSFEVMEISSMLKVDVIELIEKAEYAEDSRALFLKRLKSTNLFERHRSFLVNPLLASMMLLTFSQNFDIPDSTHLFYEQAFDALYQRHDSYKPGGYKREFKTLLPENVFKRVVSYFCLLTYSEQKLNFSREAAISFLDKAIKLSLADADPVDFLNDLQNCVCFLILDGLFYVFSHRSFQEYFAAYCIAYVTKHNFIDLVSKFNERSDDQVITLLADMDPESFRRLYILPMASRLNKELQIGSPKKSVVQFYAATGPIFRMAMLRLGEHVRRSGREIKEEAAVFLNRDSTVYRFVILCERLRGLEANDATPVQDRANSIFLTRATERLNVSSVDGVIIASDGVNFSFEASERSEKSSSKRKIVQDEHLSRLFEKTWPYDYLKRTLVNIEAYITSQREIESKISLEMNSLIESLSSG